MHRPTARLVLSVLLAGSACAPALAYVVAISPGPRSAYLRVGDGGSGTYLGTGGRPGESPTINTVSVSVPAAALGAGPQPMTTDTVQTRSSYDSYTFCDANEVYVGGFVRGGSGGQNGTLSADAPAALTEPGGQTLPFSEISWTSSGNGDGANPQPIPAGAFDAAPGPQTLATFNRNTWRESCHRFSYANSQVVGAGTYRGRVTYTLAVP